MLATTLVGYRAVERTLISVLSLYKDFSERKIVCSLTKD